MKVFKTELKSWCMLFSGMIWQMRSYAIVWDFNTMIFTCYVMLWCMLLIKSAWTDYR